MNAGPTPNAKEVLESSPILLRGFSKSIAKPRLTIRRCNLCPTRTSVMSHHRFQSMKGG